MKPMPLWQRALVARQLEELAQSDAERLALSRERGQRGHAQRRHRSTEVGDMIGCRRVVECLGPGRNGRADKSYRRGAWVSVRLAGARRGPMDPNDFDRAVELMFVMYVALALWAIGLALQMAMLAQ